MLVVPRGLMTRLDGVLFLFEIPSGVVRRLTVRRGLEAGIISVLIDKDFRIRFIDLYRAIQVCGT